MADSSLDDAFSERLIKIVSNHPELYDKSQEGYKDATLKDNTWTAIAKELNTKYDIVIRRWKALRDSYNRNLREIKKNGTGTKKVVPYKFAQKMQFLEGHLKHRSGHLSIVTKEEPVSDVEESYVVDPINTGESETAGSPSLANVSSLTEWFLAQQQVNNNNNNKNNNNSNTTNNNTPGPRRKRSLPTDPVYELLLSCLNAKSSRPSERDEDDLWLLSLAPSLRRLNDYQKGLAKLRIQHCLLEIEFGGQVTVPLTDVPSSPAPEPASHASQ